MPRWRETVLGAAREPVTEVESEVMTSTAGQRRALPGWRSLLLFGQGPGGTFYQALDVTEAGMGVDPAADGLSAVSSMLAHYDTPNESIVFKWAFPNYNSFDPTYVNTFRSRTGLPAGSCGCTAI